MAIASNGYQGGFGNEFASEAIAGALPEGRNSPQRVAHGLYAEQLSGTAFTAPRHQNRRSWLYRIRPAAMHGPFELLDHAGFHNDFDSGPVTPDQLRWNALPIPEAQTDFVDGLLTMAGNGSPASQCGIGVHMYAANASMQGRWFYDADGELLIVPQQGRLHIETELGVLDVAPQEIAVIPRGIRFRVALPEGAVRGYVCENFGAFLRLPDLGPIGSNGLANPRDFFTPNAAFEDVEGTRLAFVDDGGAGPAFPWGESPVPAVHQIRSLGPVTITVPALGPTERFLVDGLGLVRDRALAGTPETHLFRIGSAGAHAEVHVVVRTDLPRARYGAGGVHHFALRVPEAQSMHDWTERLDSLGYRHSGIVDRHYFRSIYVREPNGILVELASDGPGFEVDGPIDPRRVSLPPFLEPRRAEIEAALVPLDPA